MPHRRHSSARPYHEATVCRRTRGASASEGGRSWLQVDCSMPADPDPALWNQLDAAIDGWRAERRIRFAFFVRKPPGLRLRLLPVDVDQSVLLHDDLADVLTSL